MIDACFPSVSACEIIDTLFNFNDACLGWGILTDEGGLVGRELGPVYSAMTIRLLSKLRNTVVLFK